MSDNRSFVTCPSEQVFNEYRRKIYGYLSRSGIPPADRDDVFGEVMLKAVAQRENYDGGRASVSTWVYVITRSVVADYFRKQKAAFSLFSQLPITEEIAAEPDYESELEDLAQQLERLSERERAIIVLRFYQDMAYTEIAAALHLSEANVRQICSRAVRKLRKGM